MPYSLIYDYFFGKLRPYRYLKLLLRKLGIKCNFVR